MSASPDSGDLRMVNLKVDWIKYNGDHLVAQVRIPTVGKDKREDALKTVKAILDAGDWEAPVKIKRKYTAKGSYFYTEPKTKEIVLTSSENVRWGASQAIGRTPNGRCGSREENTDHQEPKDVSVPPPLSGDFTHLDCQS